MRTREPFELPEDKQEKLRRAVRLEWITIGFLISITVVMFLTMGASQAMKTAWIEDVLSLIPPIAFLIAMRLRDREPDERYPYGHRRVTLLSFLAASVAVLVLGLYMLWDAGISLGSRHHPTLGHMDVFGYQIWSGWVMIAALTYSMIPPFILGRMKLPIAEEVHEQTLHADADMNKADWMTAGSAILGILGVGVGFWWADSAAAAFIALEVTRDGVTNARSAMRNLMDHRPTEIGSDKPLGIVEKVRGYARELPDVRDAECRFRVEGHVFSGELFVVLTDQPEVARRVEEIRKEALAIDWRIHDIVVMPVESLER